jgi:hypothetical protein
VALVHHPVLSRAGEVLTTTITNIDLHDISRCVSTYGLEALYVVHPFESQRLLTERILRHWIDGAGGKRIPDRSVALRVIRVVTDLDEALADFGDAQVWTTAAHAEGQVLSFGDARPLVEADGAPIVLCFGTGWGLAPALIESAAQRLEPIKALRDSGYNHLSVRAAVAITLDRLFG